MLPFLISHSEPDHIARCLDEHMFYVTNPHDAGVTVHILQLSTGVLPLFNGTWDVTLTLRWPLRFLPPPVHTLYN